MSKDKVDQVSFEIQFGRTGVASYNRHEPEKVRLVGSNPDLYPNQLKLLNAIVALVKQFNKGQYD